MLFNQTCVLIGSTSSTWTYTHTFMNLLPVDACCSETRNWPPDKLICTKLWLPVFYSCVLACFNSILISPSGRWSIDSGSVRLSSHKSANTVVFRHCSPGPSYLMDKATSCPASRYLPLFSRSTSYDICFVLLPSKSPESCNKARITRLHTNNNCTSVDGKSNQCNFYAQVMATNETDLEKFSKNHTTESISRIRHRRPFSADKCHAEAIRCV